MKKPVFVRPLKIDMNDHYSTAELYSVFQEQVFRKAGEIDVPLLRETTMAIDDRPDDEVAPNRSIVWQRIEIRRRELQKSFVGKYSRKTIALAVILMVLLLAGLAFALINWNAVIEDVYRLEKQERTVEDLSLKQKEDIVEALEESGYDMSTLPDYSGKNETEKDEILSQWLTRQLSGEVNAGHFNLMSRLRGFFDSWSLEDKAWYYQMLVEAGEAAEGEFISSYPPTNYQKYTDGLLNRAWEQVYAFYDDTAVEPESFTPYLFYGYIYPDENNCYWRVHFRDEYMGNWFTVQVDGTDPLEGELGIVLSVKAPKDVG